MTEINGVAHVILSVSNWQACRDFYERLLSFFGMTRTFDGDEMVYFVGGRTAVGISKCDPAFEHERFVQTRPGLHHVCFRVRDKHAVIAVHEFLQSVNATIVHGPEEGKDPGQNYLVNTEGVPEWLQQGAIRGQ